MAKRKLTAYKRALLDPGPWSLRHNKRIVFHRVEDRGIGTTPDGDMRVVAIQQNVELANPEADVIALVGKAITYRKGGVVDPQSPDLWFWEDKFWVQAKAGDGTVYYNNKCYLLYEVEVADKDLLMSEIITGFGPAVG